MTRSAVGVIGLGYVGQAVTRMYDRFDVPTIGWDIAAGFEYPQSELAKADYVVICVNTPSGPDGAADCTRVWEAVRRVPNERVVVKSTVSPGTIDAVTRETGKQVCFWPEYIGEGSYLPTNAFREEVSAAPFVIVGG